MKKRVLSVGMILLILVSLLPFDGMAAETPPEGFEGYTVIRDYNDLKRMSMSGKYVLVNDIDLTDALSEGGALYSTNGWVALGYRSDPNICKDFTGTLDGNGHSIIGLSSNGVGAGLIWSNKGTIRNLTIESGNIQGTGTVTGAIADYNYGIIENCHNFATVNVHTNTKTPVYVGGVTGSNQDTGSIIASSNQGDVFLVNDYEDCERSCSGGIAGTNYGIIEQTYNAGTIHTVTDTNKYGTNSVAGGIVGCTIITDTEKNITSSVTNVYNKGDVSVDNQSDSQFAGGTAGGIIGYFSPYYLEKQTISKCYNAGIVKVNAPCKPDCYEGSICGYYSGNQICSTMTFCYYLNNLDRGIGNKLQSQDPCMSLSDAQMRRNTAFVGFDFTNVWSMGSGEYAYPVFDGEGSTANHVYEITNALELYDIRYDMAGDYVLMNDIDLTEALAEGGELYNKYGWNAIGYSTLKNMCMDFTGSFDGNGHSIIGLNSSGLGAGLFWSNKGTIRNVTIKSGEIEGAGPTIGAIVTYNYGAIDNCHNYANIYYVERIGDYSPKCVGGIAGVNEKNGEITNCSNHGNITMGTSAEYTVGGIASQNGGTIDRAWNSGNIQVTSVSRDSRAGGIVGDNISNTKSIITNSYNSGAVYVERTYNSSGSSSIFFNAGGIIGTFWQSDEGSAIRECYNVGAVTCIQATENFHAGGICGYCDSKRFDDITSCYYLNDIDCGVGVRNGYTDPCISLSSSQMCRSTAFDGFDFENIWSMGTGDYMYPVLNGEGSSAEHVYEIKNALDLYEIRYDMAGDYVLMNDIDLTGALAEGGELYNKNGWIALGYSARTDGCVAFTGTFEGNGHVITGLNSVGVSAGLFWSNQGTIQNLTIASGEIYGEGLSNSDIREHSFGSIANTNYGTIDNCHNYANISAETNTYHNYGRVFAGGITGNNQETGVIMACSNHGTVTVVNGYSSMCGTSAAGGIAGCSSGSIDRVWNNGSVQTNVFSEQSEAVAGGIVGCTDSSSANRGKIANAYNTGAVHASDNVTKRGYSHARAGGIIGSFISNLTISACYNNGAVTAVAEDGIYIGGVCGVALRNNVSNITNCYYFDNINQGIGNLKDDPCISLSDDQMKKRHSFVGFDFDSIWTMGFGDYLYPILSFHKHELQRVESVQETCTEDGIAEHWTCSTCGAKFMDASGSISASNDDLVIKAGHQYIDEVIPPSCTENGYTIHTCSRCGKNYTDSYVDLLGHKTELKNDKAATCTEDGYTGDEICSTCGEIVKQGEVIKATGHKTELKNDKAATCTADGYTGDEICSTCGEVVKQGEVIKATGHKTELKNDKAATCTEDGYTGDEICSTCGEIVKQGEVIKATGHKTELKNDKAATCTEDGYTGDEICSTCGETVNQGTVIKAAGHKWDDGKVTKQPTEAAEGTKTFTCTICGETRTESIPKLTPSTPTNPFADVEQGKYYYNPVLWAVNYQITNGTTATTFSPNEPCTRGQVVTFLWRASGCPEPKSASNPFMDVASEAYYYKAVLWAVENGITNGMSAAIFSPEDPCTRAHVVTFLWRSAGTPAAGSTNPFEDVAAGQYYTNAVLWAVSNNITSGTTATTFGPDNPCTRGQVVTFLYRYMR